MLAGIRAWVVGFNTLCFSDGNVAAIEKNMRSLFPDLKDMKLSEDDEKIIDQLAADQLPSEEERKATQDMIKAAKIAENPELFAREIREADKAKTPNPEVMKFETKAAAVTTQSKQQ